MELQVERQESSDQLKGVLLNYLQTMLSEEGADTFEELEDKDEAEDVKKTQNRDAVKQRFLQTIATKLTAALGIPLDLTLIGGLLSQLDLSKLKKVPEKKIGQKVQRETKRAGKNIKKVFKKLSRKF